MYGRVLPEHFWGPIVEACRAEEDPTGCLLAADGLGQPGAGPLVLDSWEPAVGATLVANPNFGKPLVNYSTGRILRVGLRMGL